MRLRFPENQIRAFAERYSYPRAEQTLLALRPRFSAPGASPSSSLVEIVAIIARATLDIPVDL
jgi:hypothetical protein